ncbi:MAG TPA: VOC family protein [Burkholderiaceae bacterium]
MSAAFAAGAIVYAKDLDRLARFYAEVAGLEIVHRVEDHAVLESATFELVVVAIPAATAARIVIARPPARREATAFKLAFPVADLEAARTAAAAAGGAIDPPAKEWRFQGLRVCDGIDPEGNVIQLREVPADEADGAGNP